MTRELRVPDPEDFCELVEMYEKRYEKLDDIYVEALQRLENKKLCNFDDYDIKCIIYPYLLRWGKMARVLGFKGCKIIGDKLGEMNFQLSKFRQEDLSTVDLDSVSRKISGIYDEIMNTEWKSEMGRFKRVGPTSASKILHLVAPNLFMMWDREIRGYYGFQSNGQEYVRFLAQMKNWIEKLKSTIEKLKNKHQKPFTKIIDEYNWIKCRT